MPSPRAQASNTLDRLAPPADAEHSSAYAENMVASLLAAHGSAGGDSNGLMHCSGNKSGTYQWSATH